jgi:serine/threonine protein kinase
MTTPLSGSSILFLILITQIYPVYQEEQESFKIHIYVHQKGIVHQAIKPAKVMLLSTGQVKITDFGIAGISATSQTQAGVAKGMSFHMSPEAFSGKTVD